MWWGWDVVCVCVYWVQISCAYFVHVNCACKIAEFTFCRIVNLKTFLIGDQGVFDSIGSSKHRD